MSIYQLILYFLGVFVLNACQNAKGNSSSNRLKAGFCSEVPNLLDTNEFVACDPDIYKKTGNLSPVESDYFIAQVAYPGEDQSFNPLQYVDRRLYLRYESLII